MQINPTANVPQSQFLSMKHKFRGFVAGYGSGKTVVGCMAQCQEFWEHPKINQGYFAPSYPQIRDIYFPTIEEVAFNMGLRVDIKETNKEVHFYNGRVYRGTTLCRSMDNPSTIIGFKIGHALVDELDVMTMDKAQMAWRKIIARMRYNVHGLRNGIDVTTTPEGFKFTHKMFVQSLIDKPELTKSYGLIQASTYQNEANLPDDYIDSMYEIYPPELISAYLQGQFVNLTSGSVYRNYDRIRCNSDETIISGAFNPLSGSYHGGDVLLIGMDFNVERMAATIYVKRGDVFHAVAELYDLLDTPEMVRVIKEKYGNHRIIVYPDSSGANRTSKGASTSDIAILKQGGFEIKVKASNPLVKDRVLAVNTALSKGRLKVNAKLCPRTAGNLEKQVYNPNGEPDKKGGHDHQNDATGYPIAYEMPIIKPNTSINIRF